MKKSKPTFYKDLSNTDEVELVLWFDFLKESIDNALIQKRRWKRNGSFWDIQVFFVAVGCIDEAIKGLGNLSYFARVEQRFWAVLTKFQNNIGQQNLKELRDHIHRDRIYNRKNKKAKPLPKGPLFIFGGYNLNKDEYTFLTHTIKVGEAFKAVIDLKKELKAILNKKLIKFYKSRSSDYNSGMISWTYLRSFNYKRRNNNWGEIRKYASSSKS